MHFMEKKNVSNALSIAHNESGHNKIVWCLVIHILLFYLFLQKWLLSWHLAYGMVVLAVS